MKMVNSETKIYIAGHHGMVGNSCWKIFKEAGYENLIGKSSRELDLRSYEHTKEFLLDEQPEIIIIAAAKVGGIHANNNLPYDFLLQNLQIQNNLISLSHELLKPKKIIFLGSSCIYPKFAPQPIKEDYLLSGQLEPTNEWYALAKIAGVKLIQAINNQFKQNHVSLMPCNLYGPNDNYDLEHSHVIPALIRKCHEAKMRNSELEIWGDGSALREFLYVDDLAKAILKIVEEPISKNLINVGSNSEISIEKLVEIIVEVIGFEGKIKWDKSRPNGTPRKIMDSTYINKIGWSPTIDLKDGIELAYSDFLKNN